MASISDKRLSPGGIARQLFLTVVLLLMLFPLAWMLIIALRERTPDFTSFFGLLSGPFTVKNFTDVVTSGPFDTYFFNSTIVALVVVVGNVLFCSMVGYALARRRIPWKGFWGVTVVAVMMIPPQVIMIPLYRLMVSFGWIDTYWALIVPFLVTPFGVFLMRQYILGLPIEVEEAARIDGATDLGILFRVIMPMAKPMLVVLAVFTFLTTWNTFLYPFLFTNAESMRTLTVGLTFYLGNQSIDWGHLMAGASISALPVIILFVIFQKQIIEGMTAGAVKG
ncbi:MAG: carbohydrate ABC transporter permease [Ignavibacteriae bacterium]|nr:carbohydrate ABC transporter permease [Ignavibacteriota bacterium]MCB9217105.1 carbohydrate ABC transporter permease [Ignavibacteria bacterium]